MVISRNIIFRQDINNLLYNWITNSRNDKDNWHYESFRNQSYTYQYCCEYASLPPACPVQYESSSPTIWDWTTLNVLVLCNSCAGNFEHNHYASRVHYIFTINWLEISNFFPIWNICCVHRPQRMCAKINGLEHDFWCNCVQIKISSIFFLSSINYFTIRFDSKSEIFNVISILMNSIFISVQ